jgi:Glycosyl transferase family 11
MIYVRLAGGLGNQLFQLAAAEVISQKMGLNYVPVLNGLARYAVARTPDSLSLLKSSRLQLTEVPALDLLMSDRLRVGRWLPFLGVTDRSFHAALSRRSPPLSSYFLDGYFQDCWDMALFQQVIDGFGACVERRVVSQGCSGAVCAVHIRGGDFLRIQQHQVLDVEYYSRSIDAAFAEGFRHFLVITDDASYAKGMTDELSKRFEGIDVSVHQGKSALDDFSCLMSAEGRIIGNSTFAWWASALDLKRAPTWSPSKFITTKNRNFFLPWEKVLKIS